MKKSKAIALMLIGMIAFAHVGAAVYYPPTTTSEPAKLQKNYLPAELPQVIGVYKTEPATAIRITIIAPPLAYFSEATQTTTRVKECKPCPTEANSIPEIVLKVGWC